MRLSTKPAQCRIAGWSRELIGRVGPNAVIDIMSYRRPKELCIPRPYRGDTSKPMPFYEPDPEAALRFLLAKDPRRDEDHVWNERQMLAEARRDIGLSPMPRRR